MLEEDPGDPVPEGIELAGGTPEEVEFHEGTLEGRPDDGRPDDGRPDDGRPGLGRLELGRPGLGRPELGRPELGRPEDGASEDSGPAAEVLEDNAGPVVKGIDGDKLEGMGPAEEVPFPNPPEDGIPEDGRPDAG